MQFSPSLYYFLLLRPKHSSQHFIFKHTSSVSPSDKFVYGDILFRIRAFQMGDSFVRISMHSGTQDDNEDNDNNLQIHIGP